jgi:hypothetical protein
VFLRRCRAAIAGMPSMRRSAIVPMVARAAASYASISAWAEAC